MPTIGTLAESDGDAEIGSEIESAKHRLALVRSATNIEFLRTIRFIVRMSGLFYRRLLIFLCT